MTLAVGDRVPNLSVPLPDSAGELRSIGAALENGPVLLGIYKSSCQASKTMFPFLERLHRRHAGTALTTLGVSQDSLNITRSFVRRGELTFPVIVEGEEFPISRAFAIGFTPSVYVIQPDGTIVYTSIGFFRDPVNDLGDIVAAALDVPAEPLYTDADAGTVPIFVPG